jgi:uncharacterized protein (TIGR03067 family)
MIGLLLTLMGTALIQDEVKPTPTELRRAHQMLAGAWTIVSATDDGTVIGGDLLRTKLVKDGRVVVRNRSITHVNPETGETLVNAFTINPAKSPRTIDLISVDDRMLPGIFKFDGDDLVICFTDGHNAERPTDFESKSGSSRIVLHLKAAADKAAVAASDVDTDEPVETKTEIKDAPAPVASTFRSLGGRRATDAELKRDRDLLGGRWRMLSIQDDGETLGKELVREKIAENGIVRIGSRGVSVVSPTDEHKRLWAYRINPAASPREIDLITQFDTILKGIYTFEDDRLVVCTAKTEDEPRPTTFNAPTGSGRVLYTLRTIPNDPPATAPAPAAPAPPPKPTPEEEERRREARIREMLVGSWSTTDSRGGLVTVFRPNGTFSATRTLAKKRLFESATKSFNGTWSFGKSHLTARVTGTTDLNMLGYNYDGRVQSIGEETMVASDFTTGGLRTFRKLR